MIDAIPAAFAVTKPDEDTVATVVLLDDQVTDLSVALEGNTEATKVWVSPVVIVKEVVFRLTPVTATVAALTFTEQVAFFAPSFVVTVIVALPATLAVITPVEETVATEVLFDVHVTDLSVALDGVIVAVSVSVSPTTIDKEVLSKLTPVTEMVFSLTVMEHVAFLPLSLVVTVIVADPAALAVTTPDEDTVATDELLEDQTMDLSVALVGVIVAFKVSVSPTVIVRLVWFRLTPVTKIGLTVTAHVAVFPPSSVLTVMTAVPTLMADT